MAICRSDPAQRIKESLSSRTVAEFYGFHPDRAGFIQCPFHAGDDHGSLKLYDGAGGWHCFGCGAGGSVIDFVMQLFGIGFRQAVLRMDTDFNLGLTNERPTRAEQSAILERRRAEAERVEALKAEYRTLAAEYRLCWATAKLFPPVQDVHGGVYIHPLYPDAVHALPALEYRLDEIERAIGR